MLLKCSMCNEFYGTLKGKYPSGSMTISKVSDKVSGYDGNKSKGTWVIRYSLKGGTKPEDNVSYSGDGRTAYLP